MVSQPENQSPANSDAIPTEAFLEQFRAATSLYQHLKELMARWNKRSEEASDATILSVCRYYQGLCQDLDHRLKDLQSLRVSQPLPVELEAIREARWSLAPIIAIDPVRVIKAVHDIREGRTTTLEQMRRELRNPAV